MSATKVFRYCLGTGRANKACPWATMLWVSQGSWNLIYSSRSEYTSRTLLLTGLHSHL